MDRKFLRKIRRNLEKNNVESSARSMVIGIWNSWWRASVWKSFINTRMETYFYKAIECGFH